MVGSKCDRMKRFHGRGRGILKARQRKQAIANVSANVSFAASGVLGLRGHVTTTADLLLAVHESILSAANRNATL
jgi:hypothetical protein